MFEGMTHRLVSIPMPSVHLPYSSRSTQLRCIFSSNIQRRTIWGERDREGKKKRGERGRMKVDRIGLEIPSYHVFMMKNMAGSLRRLSVRSNFPHFYQHGCALTVINRRPVHYDVERLRDRERERARERRRESENELERCCSYKPYAHCTYPRRVGSGSVNVTLRSAQLCQCYACLDLLCIQGWGSVCMWIVINGKLVLAASSRAKGLRASFSF